MLAQYWQIFIDDGIRLVIQHLRLVFFSVSTAIIIALPIGIILSRNFIKNYSEKLIFIFNIAQGLPSLAVIALVLPFLGVGFLPAVTALIIYALLPIIRNTIAGLNNIEAEIIEAARGMGMTPFEILYKVELPLALPVIIAGIQTAAVVTVGTAVVSNLIGAGGLGQMIFTGLAMFDRPKIVLGSLLAALIAIILDRSFEILGRKLK